MSPDQAPADVAVGTVLVPVDGSEDSATAAEYAVELADRYAAAVHAVYVYSEEVVRAIENDLVDDEEVSADARAFLDRIDEWADERGVQASSSTAYGFSTTRKTTHPGSVVLDTAEEVGADFLVIPREDRADEPGDVLEKAAQYVLLYASQPVLSV